MMKTAKVTTIYEDKILWKDSNRHSPYDTLYMYDISTNKKIKLVGEVQLAGVPDYRGDIITFRSYSKAYIINLKDNSKKMLDFVRTDPVTNGELVVCQEYLYNVETGESNYLDEIIPAAKNGGSFDIYGNLLIWVDDTGGIYGCRIL